MTLLANLDDEKGFQGNWCGRMFQQAQAESRLCKSLDFLRRYLVPVSLDAVSRASGDRSVNRTGCCHSNRRDLVDCPAVSAWVICIIVSVGLRSGVNQLLRWCADSEQAGHRSAKATAKSDTRVSTPFTDNDVVETLIPVTWVSTPARVFSLEQGG